MKRITSPDNATFKVLQTLAHSGRERRKQGRTVLDGLHLVEAWCNAYGVPELLVVSDHGLQQKENVEFLETHPTLVLIEMPDLLFGLVSPVETPTGILALIRIPSPPPRRDIRGSCVVLDAVQDAGNLGSILRNAAAAGIEDVLLGQGCAQAWSPKVLRASMGAHFVLRLHEHADVTSALGAYPGRIVATTIDAAETLYDLDLTGPVAWLFGSEGGGLSPSLAGLAARKIKIPMRGHTQSLNVAAAAAVCLFEELRQKLYP